MKKVFISYCLKRYDDLVETLATNLHQKYDVVFDKWEIKHGHNLDFFMEESIRNADKVLIMCESEYTKKANKRVSGVGVETSIISSKVYRDTKQEKFIPIFLEGINNKPDYLESVFGIEINPEDLSNNKLMEIENAIEGKTILEKPEFSNANLFSNNKDKEKDYQESFNKNLKENLNFSMLIENLDEKKCVIIDEDLLKAFEDTVNFELNNQTYFEDKIMPILSKFDYKEYKIKLIRNLFDHINKIIKITLFIIDYKEFNIVQKNYDFKNNLSTISTPKNSDDEFYFQETLYDSEKKIEDNKIPVLVNGIGKNIPISRIIDFEFFEDELCVTFDFSDKKLLESQFWAF